MLRRILAGLLIGLLASATLLGADSGRRYITVQTTTDKASGPPLSAGVVVGNTFYVSGQLGIDPATHQLGADADSEARLTMEAVQRTLQQAGVTTDDLVSVTVYCTDLTLFDRFNTVYRTFSMELSGAGLYRSQRPGARCAFRDFRHRGAAPIGQTGSQALNSRTGGATDEEQLNRNTTIVESANKPRRSRLNRRELLRMIGTTAGSAAMYQAMTSMGLAHASPYDGPINLQGAPKDSSVLVLGAGIAGMTAAYELRNAGYQVQVLELQRPPRRTQLDPTRW